MKCALERYHTRHGNRIIIPRRSARKGEHPSDAPLAVVRSTLFTCGLTELRATMPYATAKPPRANRAPTGCFQGECTLPLAIGVSSTTA